MNQTKRIPTEDKSRRAAVEPVRSSGAKRATVTDNRPEASAQLKLIGAVGSSPYIAAQRKQLGGLFGEAIQRQGAEEEKPVQGRFEPLQRKGPRKEEGLQMKSSSSPVALPGGSPSHKNNTGLPDGLKAGVESLSGMSLDNVKVHYNSMLPAQLSALAYAQGTDIHIAPGQERHLPHEAWHTVQQAQGRVRPTLQARGGVPVNDDAGLEHEADVMGAKALVARKSPAQLRANGTDVVQRVVVTVDTYAGLMAAGAGNFTVGEATKTQANKIGSAWIGRPATAKYNVSADGLRQYRKAMLKKGSGKTQANLESRAAAAGAWTKNGHIDIVEAG
jgi:hypothetical protein